MIDKAAGSLKMSVSASWLGIISWKLPEAMVSGGVCPLVDKPLG